MKYIVNFVCLKSGRLFPEIGFYPVPPLLSICRVFALVRQASTWPATPQTTKLNERLQKNLENYGWELSYDMNSYWVETGPEKATHWKYHAHWIFVFYIKCFNYSWIALPAVGAVSLPSLNSIAYLSSHGHLLDKLTIASAAVDAVSTKFQNLKMAPD